MANWDVLKDAGYPIGSEDDIINSLPGYLEAASIDRIKFAASVIEDKSESWFIRAEVCRFIRDIESDDWNDAGVCTAIHDVLSDENENLTLKQWASFLIDKCQNSSSIAEQVYIHISKSDETGQNMIESLAEANFISEIFRTQLLCVLESDAKENVKRYVSSILGL